MKNYESELRQLIVSTGWFLEVLRTVRECNSPDWLVGGGVIRTLVWDHQYDYPKATPLRDLDVAYFDTTNLRPERDIEVEGCLRAISPNIPWQARNQAAVHLWYEKKFGFLVPPLISSEDDVGTWPETATSVAVRLLDNNELYIAAPCGLEDLFELNCRRNPRRVTRGIFESRLTSKKITETWPNVRIIHD